MLPVMTAAVLTVAVPQALGVEGAPPPPVTKPTHVDFRVLTVYSIKDFVSDQVGATVAHCSLAGLSSYEDNDQPCAVHATVTLSAKTAKAAHIANPRISDLQIPLTTLAEQNAAAGYQEGQRWHNGRLRLGLSSSEKKKLGALTSVTITVRASYTLGSAGPRSLGEKTITMTRTKKPADVSLRNYRGANEF
jgi:hypothetical protein